MDLMEFHANEKDHASTQYNLPPDMAAAVTELGKIIWPVDLHEKGREKEPHVTALYGLKGSNPVPVVKATGKLGPVTLTFGKVSVFKVPAKGFDVVKIDVRKTPGLMAVREALEKLPRVAPSFPDYEPHVTVAYVKPGQGEKYCGRCELTGKSVAVGELTYSDRQEQKTVIPLTGDVRQKVNAAVPALGYALVPLRYRGVKVNEFDPNQPRDESGKWTDSGQNYGRPPIVGEDKLPYKTAVRLFYPDNRLGEQMEAAEMKRVAVERLLFRLQSRKTDMKACVDRLTGFVSENTDGPAYNARLQDTVARLIDNWAESSSDHNPLSLAIQVAAQHEFGIAGTDAFIKTRIEALGTGAERSVFDKFNTPEVQEGLRCFLRAQYDETQYHLKQQGVETLTAFRGVVAGDTYKALALVGDNVEVSQNPLSSWSNNVEKALQFSTRGFDQTAGVVMVSTFNRQDVLGMPGRGFGCQDEEEYVVRGGAFRVACVTAPELATEINEAMRRGEAEQPVKRVLDILKRQEDRVNRLAAKHNTKESRFHLDKEDVNADWIDRSKDVMLNTPHVNEQDEEGNEGRWVTMSGTPVFIKDGEDAGTAAARTFKNKPSTEEAPKKEGALKKWLREKTAPLREAFEQGRAGAKPSPMQKAIPVTSKPAAVSGKIQRIREVGLGAKETVAELFYKRHVDEVFSGKVSSADKVDALMKKGVIKTGSEKPDVVRERAIRDFDKAVILREQAAADRTESGEGKRAYTDKTLRAGLQKGETLAERYFPGHVDDLYNGTTSVTAKVDSMIEGGELGFGRGDKGFTKMRETAIKDFTRALNLREAADVKEEKRKLEDAKPKKLTKREQQAEWTPSEDEVLASGPVVSSGTGWKRNMAENQPRDADGKWTSIGPVYHGTRREFTEFDNAAQPVHRIGDAAVQPSFVYFSGEERAAVSYAYRGKEGRPRVIAAMLNMKNPLDITDSIRKQRKKGVPFGKAKQEALSQLTDAHDGFIYRGDTYNAAEYAVRSSQQITTVPKANAFDPNQPRDTDGKWTGGTLSFKGEPEKVGAFTKDVAIRRSTVTGPDGKPVMTWHNPDGSQVTDEKVLARIEEAKGTALFIPGYKGAWLNPDVTSDLIGFGFDQADRAQYVYTKEHAERSNAKTFKIVDEMRTKIDGMRRNAAKDRKAGVAAAFLFKLEDMTCIRVGSDNDTKAKKQAYGLTTLRGEHVKVEGSVVRLDFTAKGGHPVSYKIKDRELATFITARKEQNGDGPLWPDVSNSKFNAYLKSLEPGAEITAHKFRHYHATRLAEAVVAQYEGKTLGTKEFKAVQREACEAAAAHLANTWSICREEYVNPTVWGRLTVSR